MRSKLRKLLQLNLANVKFVKLKSELNKGEQYEFC